jgi:hypothetical protein
MESHPMRSDHKRLEALRRITVKRGATKAEAATAKRLADELEAKIGKKPRARRRKGRTAAPRAAGGALAAHLGQSA